MIFTQKSLYGPAARTEIKRGEGHPRAPGKGLCPLHSHI